MKIADHQILFIYLCVFLFSGCATVFKGYVSEVEIKDAPENLTVETIDGFDIPIEFASKKMRWIKSGYYNAETPPFLLDTARRVIQLRLNKDYYLVFKDSSSESYYYVYPKLNGWWVLLDVVCGVFPVVIDAYTGNWNYFEPIVYLKK